MSTYEMAWHYYRDYTPPLWDKSRLEALVAAGRLTEAEMQEITEEGEKSRPE